MRDCLSLPLNDFDSTAERWLQGFFKVRRLSFVDPSVLDVLVRRDTIGEPECNLLLSGFNGVRTVADVTTNRECVVTADSTRSGRERVGSTEHDTTGLYSIETLNDYSNYGPREHVLDEAGEEGLAGEVLVVLLEVLLRRSDHLEGDDLETPLFKTRDDGSNKVTLDAIGLDHDIGALVVRHGGQRAWERTRESRKEKMVVSMSLIVC